MNEEELLAAQVGAPGGEEVGEADQMIPMLLAALQQGWTGQEAQIDEQKTALLQVIMSMLQSQAGPAIDPMQGYAEGSMGPVAVEEQAPVL